MNPQGPRPRLTPASASNGPTPQVYSAPLWTNGTSPNGSWPTGLSSSRSWSAEGWANESTGFVEALRLLGRHKTLLVLVTMLGGILAAAFSFSQTPVYRARGSLEVQNQNGEFMNIRTVDPNAPGVNDSAESYLQTQVKILESEPVTDRVVEKMKAAGLGKSVPLAAGLDRWFGVTKMDEEQRQSQSFKDLVKSLESRVAAQTHIVEIYAQSPDPAIAAKFVNMLEQEMIQQNLDARIESSQETGQWLAQQLADMRTRLEKSEDALQAYARNTGLLITGEKDNISEDKLREVQNELSHAQADRIIKQSRYEIASKSTPETLADVLSDATLRDYQTQITTLRRQLAEAEATYTPEHYKVTRLQAQLASVTTAFAAKSADILGRIRNDFAEAQRREDLLSKSYDQQAGVVTTESGQTIRYRILKREVDSNRTLYESMLSKVKESGMLAALRANNIRIMEPAKVPDKRYKPSYSMNIGLGCFAGLLFGAAFAAVRERANKNVQEPGESQTYLNLQELGVIPSLALESQGGRRRMVPEGRLLPAPKGQPDNDKPELASWYHGRSMVAESFRYVLTSLEFFKSAEHRNKVVVVTSTGPGEGKSTITSNLAIALAETGARVLLIDADFHKPRQHEIFGMSNDLGLLDLLTPEQTGGESAFIRENSVPGLYLSHELDLFDYVAPEQTGAESAFIRETAVAGLYLLTSGSKKANGEEAASLSARHLNSRLVVQLLDRCRRNFDTILIDTPPALQISDARVLGSIADGIILVLRSGQTSRDAAAAMVQRFAEDGLKVLGTILNDWRPGKSAAGYYGGYYKQYRSYYQ